MIQPYAYYTVQGWMLSDLGLKGNALAVYAIIYGFSQDGESEYSGSARYLSEWLGCSTRTILSVLADLTERGLLKKTTTYKNGLTFNTYSVVKMVKEAPKQPGAEISHPMKNFHGGHEEISPGGMKNFHGGHEEISPNNTRDNTRYINKEIYIGDADASTAPPEKEKDKEKPVKHKYGEYTNVLLTNEELAKLQKQFGHELPAYIERLSGYIASTGKKYKSHYATIRNWASRDAKQQPARSPARGGYAGPVGPNGIHIDPTMNDLDGQF